MWEAHGLASKKLTPAMVKAVLDELVHEKPRNHFTIGIHDDVSRSSLPGDADFTTDTEGVGTLQLELVDRQALHRANRAPK